MAISHHWAWPMVNDGTPHMDQAHPKSWFDCMGLVSLLETRQPSRKSFEIYNDPIRDFSAARHLPALCTVPNEVERVRMTWAETQAFLLLEKNLALPYGPAGDCTEVAH